MVLKKIIKNALVNKNNARYKKELEGRQYTYNDWILKEEAGYEASLAMAGEEEYLLLCNPGGHLSDFSVQWLRQWMDRYPDAVVFYGDEDVLEKGGKRRCPFFKPDWSPDLLEQYFYLGSAVGVRKSWLNAQAPMLLPKWELADCGQSTPKECRKLVLETVKLAGGYEKDAERNRIMHIPRILFHNQSEEAMAMWLDYGKQLPKTAATDCKKFVSVIIPSKDNPDLLEKCIGSILEHTVAVEFEIIVVDNGSRQEKRRQTEAVLRFFRQEGRGNCKRILYHYEKMDFNFSKMCNLGVRKASGQFLLFLNDDVTLMQDGTLERMASLAARPFSGAVGLKLLYPFEAEGTRRIQHVGITNLPMGPVHKLQFCEDEGKYYLRRNKGRHNMLAVTAACLMVEKNKFMEAGGFAEELAVAFNDVDLCYSLYHCGYTNVCECDWFACHAESYSRGDDESAEKLSRLLGEREKLYERHPFLVGKDPYYPVYLSGEGLDTGIRPVYEMGKNPVQKVHQETVPGFEEVFPDMLSDCREDACLMVRAESLIPTKKGWKLVGWSVVLGDNNACYTKQLLLKDMEGKCLILDLQEQYRPDLTEHMPDQINVGLCGFCLEWEREVLPSGNYLLGVMAKNRINGKGLINWSNRMVEV